MIICLFMAITCFILGLKRQAKPLTAKQGNLISAVGMLFALIPAFFYIPLDNILYLIIALSLGTVIGLITAKKIAMTRMPELVAAFNGFGGLASFLVGLQLALNPEASFLKSISVGLAIIIGSLTFTGSIIAWFKLAEWLKGSAGNFLGLNILNALLFIALIANLAACVAFPTEFGYYLSLSIIGLILGLSTVIPIGGGDMPVVIALLNSFSGLAASAAGFSLQNPILIIAGTLVGASGLILTLIMCKAMNRPIQAVLFSGFSKTNSSKQQQQGTHTALSVEDAYYALEAARSIVIVPGYGLAVAQAQHVVKELVNQLRDNGCDVRFGIHPVAGRMPGHMNVLLAEAQVDYELLQEMEPINEILPQADICLVVGANDVVNPDALDNPDSPIYQMPIIQAHTAKMVFVLKRSMKPGFAGIENPLFFKENTRMIFGDAKSTLQGMVKELEKTT